MKRTGPPGLKAVLFDFDGVLVESADIKTEAFRELFSGHPAQREAVVRYHVHNAGLSRFRKFDYIYKKILKKPLSPAERARLGREFSRLVFRKVVACRQVAGAEAFLRKHSRRLKLFVVSGTPQTELRRIARERAMGSYFRGVFGSPRTKAELAAGILRRFRLAPGEAVFVGDARADWEAARRNGIPFLGRVPAGRRSIFPAAIPRLRDLRGLEPWLRRRGLLRP